MSQRLSSPAGIGGERRWLQVDSRPLIPVGCNDWAVTHATPASPVIRSAPSDSAKPGQGSPGLHAVVERCFTETDNAMAISARLVHARENDSGGVVRIGPKTSELATANRKASPERPIKPLMNKSMDVLLMRVGV